MDQQMDQQAVRQLQIAREIAVREVAAKLHSEMLRAQLCVRMAANAEGFAIRSEQHLDALAKAVMDGWHAGRGGK